MNRRASAAALILALLCISGARADEVAAPYFSLLGEYVHADRARNAGAGYGPNAILGVPLARQFALEIGVHGSEFDGRAGGPHDQQYGLGIDADWRLLDRSVTPFVLIGIGLDYDTRYSGAAPYLDAGAGLVGRFGEHWALRGEARYAAVYDDNVRAGKNVLGDIHFGAGLQYSFGRSQPLALPAEHTAVVNPVDTETPIPPPPLAEPAQAAALPASPEASQETAPACADGAATCAPDADGDGVPDTLDQCPYTQPGLKVDAMGCAVGATAPQPVYFTGHSDQLDDAAKAVLDELTLTLVLQPQLGLEIVGHTDGQGSQAANLALSQRRAQVVRDYLVGKGVAAERITTSGLGPFAPAASNATEAGRIKNRRVEFRLIVRPAAG
jgi:OOP family OmpA-OmpF porin